MVKLHILNSFVLMSNRAVEVILDITFLFEINLHITFLFAKIIHDYFRY